MPRTTHPQTRHRHDRAHIRFHRDRVVKKRGRAYARYHRATLSFSHWERERIEGPWGINEDEAMWFGCHRARCGLCHYIVWSRTLDERAWRAYEGLAW